MKESKRRIAYFSFVILAVIWGILKISNIVKVNNWVEEKIPFSEMNIGNQHLSFLKKEAKKNSKFFLNRKTGSLAIVSKLHVNSNMDKITSTFPAAPYSLPDRCRDLVNMIGIGFSPERKFRINEFRYKGQEGFRANVEVDFCEFRFINIFSFGQKNGFLFTVTCMSTEERTTDLSVLDKVLLVYAEEFTRSNEYDE
jgi:hypothetical protein